MEPVAEGVYAKSINPVIQGAAPPSQSTAVFVAERTEQVANNNFGEGSSNKGKARKRSHGEMSVGEIDLEMGGRATPENLTMVGSRATQVTQGTQATGKTGALSLGSSRYSGTKKQKVGRLCNDIAISFLGRVLTPTTLVLVGAGAGYGLGYFVTDGRSDNVSSAARIGALIAGYEVGRRVATRIFKGAGIALKKKRSFLPWLCIDCLPDCVKAGREEIDRKQKEYQGGTLDGGAFEGGNPEAKKAVEREAMKGVVLEALDLNVAKQVELIGESLGNRIKGVTDVHTAFVQEIKEGELKNILRETERIENEKRRLQDQNEALERKAAELAKLEESTRSQAELLQNLIAKAQTPTEESKAKKQNSTSKVNQWERKS